MKIGDRIRYLNDVGGGIVAKILKDRMVSILQDDGFEIPVMAAECVVIEEVRKPTMKNETLATTSVVVEENYTPDEDLGPEGDLLNILLAFLPVEKQDNQFDAYIINDSNYYMYYTLLREESTLHHLIASGMIESNTKLHLGTYTATQLEQWANLTLQLLPFKKQAFQLKGIVQQHIKLNTVRFYKSNSFTKNRYFTTPARIEQVLINDFPEIPDHEIIKALEFKNSTEKKPQSKPHYKPLPLEIDLHINKLKDDYVGMSNTDMLNFQLDTFKQVMRESESNHGQEIVFIHGVGNGTLKAELRKQLQEDYDKHDVQDASFKEYGFGATRVTIV